MSSIEITNTGSQRTARLISDDLHPKTWFPWPPGRMAEFLPGGPGPFPPGQSDMPHDRLDADHLRGLLWSLVGVLFAAVIPILFIDHGIKGGRWGDRNAGAEGAIAGDGGHPALRPDGLGPHDDARCSPCTHRTRRQHADHTRGTALVTSAWKISVHQAVSAGAVIMLAQTYGPWALSAYILVAVVGWSRVELRDHTPAQVIAGTLLGTTVAAVVFAALR